MERKYKITIPEPCQEDWNKMTPNDNGRFCGSCSKNVVDFTNMLPKEIQAYFLQHSNVCGRFKKSQLDSLTIQIPNHVLYSQTHYHKMFLLALFIAMGTTLFSCSDKNGSKQKIDKVEVVDDTLEINNTTVGMRLPPKADLNDSLHHKIPPPPPPKIEQVKFVKPKTIGCGETTKQNTIEEDVIYSGGIGFEIAPEYVGGREKFYSFFRKEFKLPNEALEKTEEIQVSFVIGRDGSLENITPVKDLDSETMEEVIRVLKKSNKWKPGEQNGKKIITRNLLSLQIQRDIPYIINLKEY
jgi:hypothetical protein